MTFEELKNRNAEYEKKDDQTISGLTDSAIKNEIVDTDCELQAVEDYKKYIVGQFSALIRKLKQNKENLQTERQRRKFSLET